MRVAVGVGWAGKESASRRWVLQVMVAMAVMGAAEEAAVRACASQRCTRIAERGRGKPGPATWLRTLRGK